jgi:integrase
VGFEFTAHDLRRTVATVASDLGYDINTIGMVLNHAKGSVTSKYIQSTHKRLKDILINIQNTLFGQSYD